MIINRQKMIYENTKFNHNLEEMLDDAKHELLQSSKFSIIGEFTAGIIHDIKNPLTILGGFGKKAAITIERENFNDLNAEVLKTSIEKMNRATHMIMEITERMGKFTRADSEFKEGVNLKTIIDTSIEMVEKKLAKNKVKLTHQMNKDVFICGGRSWVRASHNKPVG